MSPSYFDTLLLIRAVEDRLQDLCSQGLAGDLHFSKGQEAIAVGVTAALRPEDKFVTHHRTIAHQIARATALKLCTDAFLLGLLAELLGKATGSCRGRAGEMHIHDRAIGHEFSFQLVGTCVPVAAGLAWALRYRQQRDDVVAVFLGDAAFGNGVVHEGLNIASVQMAPLLVVVESNSLAGNIESPFYRPPAMPFWELRFASYAMDCKVVTGNDPRTVEETAGACLAQIRRSSRPMAMVCETQRLCWHKQGQRDVRLPTEIAHVGRFDPLLVMQRRLGLTPEEVLEKRAEVDRRLDPIFEQVLKDPPAEMHYDD